MAVNKTKNNSKEEALRSVVSSKICHINYMQLKGCTLTLAGFDRIYSSVRILSSRITSRSYSAGNYHSGLVDDISVKEPFFLKPWFVTGFTDAEGCFLIKLRKRSDFSTGWSVQPEFQIKLHQKDKELLNLIKSYFGSVGAVSSVADKDSLSFTVSRLEDNLAWIIPHFDKFPLITQKSADYLLFREVVMMMQRKEHLTDVGLQAIINIRASLNWGLTQGLKEAFPESVAVPRPSVVNLNISDPEWIAGFASGEGCFFVNVTKSKTYKIGFQVLLRFQLVQHSRDELLMRSLVDYFKCGKFSLAKGVERGDFVCEKFTDNYEKIIPFFNLHHIKGVKLKDFHDWCQVAELIKNKAHLNEEGLEQIRLIKSGMNRGRTN